MYAYFAMNVVPGYEGVFNPWLTFEYNVFSILFLFFTLISTNKILTMCSYNLFRFYYHLLWKECFECALKSLWFHSIFINFFLPWNVWHFMCLCLQCQLHTLVVFLHLTMYDTKSFLGGQNFTKMWGKNWHCDPYQGFFEIFGKKKLLNEEVKVLN